MVLKKIHFSFLFPLLLTYWLTNMVKLKLWASCNRVCGDKRWRRCRGGCKHNPVIFLPLPAAPCCSTSRLEMQRICCCCERVCAENLLLRVVHVWKGKLWVNIVANSPDITRRSCLKTAWVIVLSFRKQLPCWCKRGFHVRKALCSSYIFLKIIFMQTGKSIKWSSADLFCAIP